LMIVRVVMPMASLTAVTPDWARSADRFGQRC
jgi:hypothetical protein